MRWLAPASVILGLAFVGVTTLPWGLLVLIPMAWVISKR